MAGLKKSTKVNQSGLTLAVLKMLDKGQYAKQIADDLNVSKQAVHKHVKKLIMRGLIHRETRSAIATYTITDTGRKAIHENKLTGDSCGTTRIKLGTHLRIKVPILRRGRLDSWDKVNTRFRNNIIRHKDLKRYIDGVSVKENSDSSLELNIKHRKLATLREILPLVTSSLMWAVGFFSAHGYMLDFQNYSVNDIHSTAWTREIEHVAQHGGRHTLWFNWNRKKLTPRDPSQRARAWTDGSPEWNVESNDIGYMDMFLRMPVTVSELMSVQRVQAENVAELARQVNVYAEHINTHLPVLREMAPTMVEMRKMVRNINRHVFQRKLGEFL